MAPRVSMTLVSLTTLVLSVRTAPTARPYYPTVPYNTNLAVIQYNDGMSASPTYGGISNDREGDGDGSGSGDGTSPYDAGPCFGASIFCFLLQIHTVLGGIQTGVMTTTRSPNDHLYLML
jgi:hypothetical protein